VDRTSGRAVLETRDDGVVQLVGKSRYGFALVEVTPERLEITFFGFRKNEPFGAFHCRSYSRDDFAEPSTRSSACNQID